MANEKRNEPSIRVVDQKVTVTRRTLEVTPDVVLSLLRRCKEIPRRHTGFVLEANPRTDVLLTVSWEETDEEAAGINELDEALEAALSDLPGDVS